MSVSRIGSFALLSILLGAAACAAPADEALVSGDSQLSSADLSNPLPNWATEEELAIERDAEFPDPRISSVPPATGYRIPAEYEPVSHVIMTWAGHTPVLSGISAAAAAAGAEVWMVGGPQSISGVAPEKYRSMPFGFNSVWSRDYGPVGINEATGKVSIVDTTYRHFAVRRDDDAMSCRIADALGGECYPTNLILDGGNYMSDGKGEVFLTSRIYDWNRNMSRAQVDALLKSHLHAEKIHVLDYAKNAQGEPMDGTGHIDMFAKLMPNCKVIVAQTTVEPYKRVTDAAAAYFANVDCGGGKYEVTRVKGWTQGRTWYTYTNSLFVNNAVIIPFYNTTADNEEAAATYRRLLPGYTVTGVLSESTIVVGGSIHCITKEIPVARR